MPPTSESGPYPSFALAPFSDPGMRQPPPEPTQLNATRQDAERFERRTRQGLVVCLTAPLLVFVLIAELPEPHPVLGLVSLLYALHLGALLRPVCTGRRYAFPPLALLAPTFVWPVCLWLLPHTGAFARAEVVPLSAMAVVPAAVVAAELSPRVQLATGFTCLGLSAAVSPDPLTSALVAGGICLTVIIAVRSLMRPVSVISRLEVAADVAARRAVAEERLRMSHDLHDTLGRHLALIALKSELVARTGKLQEMEEVQVLARTSQSELRAVVNAVRTASLDDELEGARSLLQAFGIRCDVIDEGCGPSLPREVREVLGWAVREAATNVIWHASEATACTFTLTVSGVGQERACELRVVNDGVRDARERGTPVGTGMSGLKRRLDPLGGSLEHGPRPQGAYRLLVTVPLAREV
ncbi:histidine kinase [Streptomyces sp. NPDC051214]|uniref:sensor histidine kinase n=1 Tax=Streptomyces sp. NPDC051214 TaxID=3155282 RepID=UPI003441E639